MPPTRSLGAGPSPSQPSAIANDNNEEVARSGAIADDEEVIGSGWIHPLPLHAIASSDEAGHGDGQIRAIAAAIGS